VAHTVTPANALATSGNLAEALDGQVMAAGAQAHHASQVLVGNAQDIQA
jgi:hypothetical protein